MPLRASCSDGANRPDAELKSESHWHKVSVRPGGDAACPFPESREFGLGDRSQQQNTHIRDLREICYPWHPWYGRTVWVRATLVKRGKAVAHCSLEDVQTSRVLEVPLWMLDVAACCKTRVSNPGFVSAQSLRELKELLDSARPRAKAPTASTTTQHRYLLEAGGADGDIGGPAEIESTPVVCSPAIQPALDKSVVRCATTDTAIAGAVTEATCEKSGRGKNGRGGAR